MAFVYEKISCEDYRHHNLGVVDSKYTPMKTVSSHWAIDRERNIHSRTVSRFVPPDKGPIKPFYLFYWKVDYIVFEYGYLQQSTLENNWSAIYELIRLEIPSRLKEFREKIISDIKAALIAEGQVTGVLYKYQETAKFKLDLHVNV